jgi:hypothetical protein
MQTTAQAPAPITAQAPAIATVVQGTGAPDANYIAARAARNELRDQLNALVRQRHSLLTEIEDHPVGGPAVAGMQQRIQGLDARIAQLDIAVATADANVAVAAAVPGAVQETPEIVRNGPPEELFFVIPSLATVVMLPLAIAFAIRMLQRGRRQAPAQLPADLGDRLARMEQMGEATALEVERIGEGQRFVTRLLTDRADNLIGEKSGVPLNR